MSWFARHSRRPDPKIIMLLILCLSFTGGLALARHMYPSPARAPLPAGKQAASVEEMVYQDDMVTTLLSNALGAGGARLESMRLEAWGSLKSSFLAGDALHDLAQQVAADLGLKETTVFTAQDEENFHALYWEGELRPGVALYISLQSLSGEGEQGETYLLTDLESRSSAGAGAIQTWREKIKALFQSRQTEPHLTYTLTGVIPGRLSPAEQQQRAHAVLAALEAQKVEGVAEEQFLSISAYSPRLPRYLEVAGRRVNTNVALRYHQTDGNTYLHLGFPLLGGEY